MDIIPAPDLQIDIFVTNVRPIAGPTPRMRAGISFAPLPRKERETVLEPPKPGFVTDAKRVSRSSFSSDESGGEESDLDLSYYAGAVQDEGDLGHEEHILDYTNFEGDDDTALPGEAQFHLSIKNEGRTRRAVSRRLSMAVFAKQELLHRASQTEFEGVNHSSVKLIPKRASGPPIDPDLSEVSLPRPSVDVPGSQRPSIDISSVRPEDDTPRVSLQSQQTQPGQSSYPSIQYVMSPLSPIPRTPNSAVPFLDPSQGSSLHGGEGGDLPKLHTHNLSSTTSPMGKRFSQLSHLSQASLLPTPATPASMQSRLSMWTDTDSFAALVPNGDVERAREQLRLTLDAQEVEDVGVVAEHARPGRPKLERVLAEEVERAKGMVAVACECSMLASRRVIC